MAKAPASKQTLKHAIVLIHGAGRYGVWETKNNKRVYKPDVDGWFDRVEATLRRIHEAVRKTVPYALPFDDKFEFVRINYDSIFQRFRQDWADQAKSWGKLGPEFSLFGLGKTETDSITKFLKSADSDNFGWNNALDLILYLAPTVREAVDSEVIDQLSTKLGQDTGKKFRRWSVIAHSLGTAVFHHAYPRWMKLANDKPPGGPEVVCMVSNLAQLVRFEDVDPYQSALRPGPSPSPATYVDCRHDFDLIARIAPFEPQWPPENFTANFVQRRVSKIYPGDEISEWPRTAFGAVQLPHEISHYMIQPEIVAELWGPLFEYTEDPASMRAAAAAILPKAAEDVLHYELTAVVEEQLQKIKGLIDEKAVIQILTDYFGG